MTTKFINLTPHTLNIQDQGGNMYEIVSSGYARAAETRTQLDPEGPFAVSTVCYGAVTGLPDPAENTAYIVSALTAQTLECQARNDIFVPGPLIRDESGKPIGCIGLSRI